MSDSLGEPWSDNPDAPQIPDWVYFEEKAYFAGVILGAVLYGAPPYPSIHLHSHRRLNVPF